MAKPIVHIKFETVLYQIKDWTILSLPPSQSLKLTSRGQISVSGKINDLEFDTVLEPDGRLGHWLRITDDMMKTAKIKSGDKVQVELTTSSQWPEPQLPADFAQALKAAPDKVKDKWQDITPMARWEWIRWIKATLSSETRAVRIEKTISKLNGKHRRPCCFNLAACTEPYVAKNAQLIEVS